MWLAKLYVNALLAVWLFEDAQGHSPGTMPVMACAAKATWLPDQASNRQALYYIAAPISNRLHSRLGLKSAGVVARDFDWLAEIVRVFASPPPRPVQDDHRILFCDRVIHDSPHRESFQLANHLSPIVSTPPFWEPKIGQMGNVWSRALGFRQPYEPGNDTDGKYALLNCCEQRVLLCHRWVEQTPAAAGLASGTKLELEEMTVALADYEYYDFPSYTPRENAGAWWHIWDRGDWWTGGTGFPMHPCNTCRVAIPALLCPRHDPPARLPGPTGVIQVLP